MDPPRESRDETFNAWSIVNLVFQHLADEGLHPTLGAGGDPGVPAAQLLRTLGRSPRGTGRSRETFASTSPKSGRPYSARADQPSAHPRAAVAPLSHVEIHTRLTTRFDEGGDGVVARVRSTRAGEKGVD